MTFSKTKRTAIVALLLATAAPAVQAQLSTGNANVVPAQNDTLVQPQVTVPVPEPESALLLLPGLMYLAMRERRRKKARNNKTR